MHGVIQLREQVHSPYSTLARYVLCAHPMAKLSEVESKEKHGWKPTEVDYDLTLCPRQSSL
jgi:hypothetical protein